MPDSPVADLYIEANDDHMGGANGTITRVVMHGTVSPCQRGGARANAHYFQRADAGGAAHYVADPGEAVQCVPEDRVAHHAPPNTGSIGVELCDPQGDTDRFGPDADDPDRWGDADHAAMLQLAARLVADICDRHRSVPVVWLTVDDLLAGRHGITSHANVAAAFHRTNHTDPGDAFPIDHFMDLVRGGQPAPAPQPPEDDDMHHAYFVQRDGAKPTDPVFLASTTFDAIVVDNLDVAHVVAFCTGVTIHPTPDIAKRGSATRAGKTEPTWLLDAPGARYFHLPA